MRQLTELDYAFVQMEGKRTPMHITAVMFYDPTGRGQGKEEVMSKLRDLGYM